MKILSFGEILWDVYDNRKCIGGAPLNFAAHMAKHGDEIYMLSALGADKLGEEAIQQIERWGVSTKYISVLNEKETGKCVVTLDKNKVPTYNLLGDVAYDYITCNAITDRFDVLYFGTLALRSESNYYSLKKLMEENEFDNVFVDINIRPPFYTKETVNFAIQNATILKISLEELATVSELIGSCGATGYKEFATRLAESYNALKCIVITLGSEGAYALDCASNSGYFCMSEKVEVKSTVGAGDSFSAAFLHKYLKKKDIPACLEHATKVAGFVVSQYDAVPDYVYKKINE